MEPFVRYERVIAHSDDTRQNDEELIVVSVGKKWITCRAIFSNGEMSFYDEKFNASTRERDKRTGYKLYHNKEEYLEEEKRQKIKRDLRLELENTIWSFSLEEMLFFKEIHETGLDEWKRLNLKNNEK